MFNFFQTFDLISFVFVFTNTLTYDIYLRFVLSKRCHDGARVFNNKNEMDSFVHKQNKQVARVGSILTKLEIFICPTWKHHSHLLQWDNHGETSTSNHFL